MDQGHDEVSRRPDRVIIVDADDPMTEIHGAFVWQDEHDRVLAEARERAFADGYDAGLRDASATLNLQMVRRHGLAHYVRLTAYILFGLFVLLMLPVLVF